MKMVMLVLMMMVAGPPTHRKGGLEEDGDVDTDGDDDCRPPK